MNNHRAELADRMKRDVMAPIAESTARSSERLARGSEELASATRQLADRTRRWADDVTGAHKRRIVVLTGVAIGLAGAIGYYLLSVKSRRSMKSTLSQIVDKAA